MSPKRSAAILFLCFTATYSCALPRSQGNVDAIKDFISRPPTVRRLVFQIEKNPSFPNRNSEHFRTNTFLAFHDSGSVYLRGIRDMADIDKPIGAGWPERVILSSTPSASWTLYRGRFFELPESLPEFWSTNKAELGIEKSAYSDLATVLNLGIRGIPLASVRWLSNSFCITNSLGVRIAGKLIITNSVVSGIELSHTKNRDSAKYDLRFMYPDDLSAVLPNRIYRSVRQNGNDVLYAKYSILDLVTQSEPLPTDSFASSGLSSEILGRFTFRNGRVFALVGGHWEEVPLGSSPRVTYQTYKPFAMFSIFVLCSTIAFGLWWKEQVNQTQLRSPNETTTYKVRDSRGGTGVCH